MAGRQPVTINDRKKAKKTTTLFAAFSAFFMVSTALLGVFTPRTKTLKGIDNSESDDIRSLCVVDNGNDYTVMSRNNFQRYSFDGSVKKETTSYIEDIKNKFGELPITAKFLSPTMQYEDNWDKASKPNTKGYYFIFDDTGDIFKYELIGENTVLSDDYWLTPRIDLKGKTYFATYLTKGIYTYENELYVLATIDNSCVINKYDANNLNAGIVASKTFVSIRKAKALDSSKYYSISNIDDKGELPFNLYVDANYIYLATDLGLRRYSKDFIDFVDEGNPISYVEDGDTNFVETIRSEMLNDTITITNSNNVDEVVSDWADKKAALGITNADITNADKFCLKQIYKIAFGDVPFVKKEKKCAKQYQAANSTWLLNYDPTVSADRIGITLDHVDPKKNLFVSKAGEESLAGGVISSQNGFYYYLDEKSCTVSYVSLNAFSNFKFDDNRTLMDVAERSGVDYKGCSFSSTTRFYYDKIANCIYTTFYASNKISILDIDENTKIPTKRATFSLEYMIRGYNQSKDKKRGVVLYQTERRDVKNNVHSYLYVGHLNPDTYKNRTLFVVLFIINIVLFAISAIVLFVSFRAYRQTKALLKLKVIQRDFKRNKFVYLALVPFVLLLIMFCWVEAIGSISFSFFSYTQEMPTYRWNTFGNYIELFHRSDFWQMFGNTAFFLAFDLFLSIVPPIFFAFCLSIIKNKKLSGVLRAAMFIPAIIPGIASLLIWKIGIFGDTGVLNQLICFFKTGSTSTIGHSDVTVNFLHDPRNARWSLLLMGFPYVGGYLIFYGGIMNIPKEYDEACQLEGISAVKRFITIDLPLIKPQIKYILIMGILSSVQNYERTYMLDSTGTLTFAEELYRQMKPSGSMVANYGMASAIATLIFLLLLVPVFWNFKNTKKTTMGDAL